MFTRRKVLTRRNVFVSLLVTLLGLTIWFVGCSPAEDPWGKPPHVLVTVPPLYSFAKSVAGDHGEVKCLCTTTGPHQFVADPTHTRLLRVANCFFTIGLGLDDKFAEPMMKATGTAVEVQVELGEKLTNKLKPRDEDEHDHARDEHGHEHGEYDPHVWLGTPQAIAMVEQIRDELKRVDADHKDDYDKNADAYIKELKKLHDDGLEMLKDKKDKRIISFHDSLEYFAKDFGIDIKGVIEKQPGVELTAPQMRELVELCKKENIRIIAVEPQFPKTSAEALRKALKDDDKDVILVEIDPLETANESDLTADLYTKTMRKNLEALAENLP